MKKFYQRACVEIIEMSGMDILTASNGQDYDQTEPTSPPSSTPSVTDPPATVPPAPFDPDLLEPMI